MKKALPILGVVIVIIAIFCGCIVWYNYATRGNKSTPENTDKANNTKNIIRIDNEEKTNNVENIISNEPIFTLDNYPRVDASLAIHPLVDSIASNFLGIPEEELNYEYTKTRTSDVYKNLVDGQVDVIFVAEPSQDDYEYAK